jgi:hypothetical protein
MRVISRATNGVSKHDSHLNMATVAARRHELARLRDRGIPDRGIAVLSLAAGRSNKPLEARCAICTALLRCFAQSDVIAVLASELRASRDERAHTLALAEGLYEGRVGRSVLVRFSNVASSELREESTW